MRLQSACYTLGAILCLTVPGWAQSSAIAPTSAMQTTSTGTVMQTTSTRAAALQPTSTSTGAGSTSTGTTSTGTGSRTGTGSQTTSTGTGTQTSSTGAGTQTSSTGAFDKLSPGGQKIAQSLYNSQNPPTGTKAMTLDQIAAMKGKEGWGRVFKDMKSDGLVQAKNLGQVVSGHAKTG